MKVENVAKIGCLLTALMCFAELLLAQNLGQIGKAKLFSASGGVSANSGIRQALKDAETKHGWTTYVPKFEFTTDNAAMIAITGYLKYL